MFFDKLLNKIPFFRNRHIKKIKRELEEIKVDFADGFFNDKYIACLHNILNTSLIDFSEEFVEGSLSSISLHTNSSLGAVKLLEKGVTKKSVLERSPLISMTMSNDYFSDWYSNEYSVKEFVDSMKIYLNVQAIQAANPNADFNTQEKVDALLSSLNPDVLDSLLYRLLLSDLVNIITFYLESKYDR